MRWRALLALALGCAACGSGSGTAKSDAGGAGDGALGDGALAGDGAVGDGAPAGDGAIGPGPTGCAAITHEAAVMVAGQPSDRFTWSDADCKLRTVALAQAGYLRQATYDAAGTLRTVTGTNANGWNGWGYVVMHYASGAATSQGVSAMHRTVLDGRHHAIHEFKLRLSPGGAVDATIHWLIATGRSHPLYSITLDSTPAGANTVMADSRSPYGDLDWDATGNDQVEGVGWGDKYRFRTTGTAPVDNQTPWRYDETNVMPYVLEWSQTANAEMGSVATLPWATRIAGGDYGGGLIMTACWLKTSANPAAGCRPAGQIMPQDWIWPYQLNQYELPFVTTSRRVAWGLTFGAVGQSSYMAFGKTLSGYPFQSYAVAMVLGRHTPSAVDAATLAMADQAAVVVTASRGTVVTAGPGGVGRTDLVTYDVPGFDPSYGVFAVRAAANAATVQLAGRVSNPILRISDFGAAQVTRMTLGGRTLVADVDYFATVDTAGRNLWLTLNASLTGTTVVTVN